MIVITNFVTILLLLLPSSLETIIFFDFPVC